MKLKTPDRISKKLFLCFFIYTKFLVVGYSQSCTTTQFSKAFTFEGFGYAPILQQKSNGEFLFGGLNNYELTLGNINNEGNLLWSKKYSIQNPIVSSQRVCGTIDLNGNYFIGLPSNCVGLFNPSGDPITTKELKIPYSDVYVLGVGILNNNQKIILVRDESTYSDNGYMLLCLSADLSTIIWNKHIAQYNAYFEKLLIWQNKILLPGSSSNLATLLSFDANNGNLLEKKTYQIDNKVASLDKIYDYPGGFIVKARYYGGQTNNHIFLRLDQNFNVISSYRFATIYDNASVELSVEPGGDFYGAWGWGGFGHDRFYINTQDSVLWNRISQVAGLTGPLKLINTDHGLVLLSSGNYFAVGNQTNYSTLVISRSDQNGYFLNCYTTDFNFQIQPITYSIGTSSIIARDTNLITLNSISLNVSNNSYIENLNCAAISTCDSVSIQGLTSYCTSDPLIFTAKRNPGCFTPVQWNISGGNVIKQKINDSTIKIIPLHSGNFKLIAKLDSLCLNIADTLDFVVTISNSNLSLGPDSSICPNNTLTLNARSGYTSYLWQDGSADSMLLVTTPGVYWVQTEDACNNILRDTIVINASPPIPFDLGPNLTKCNSDSLNIVAPTGFSNYSWSPNYNINSTTGQSVIIFPSIDTMYKVTAEKTPGCFAYDSIYVSVNNSLSIYLGADTSFCSGNSIVLDAGNGFTNYLWNTGESSPSIIVNTAGAFSIIATDVNSCISKDTLRVRNVFNNPAVNLPNDSLLCKGSSKNLNAGAGMASYLWSNGATTNSISVNNTGTYWVNVIDNNGCKGTDTTAITRLLALPAAFLPADTVLCSYSTLKISASQTYLSYLWSTGSLQNNITISQPGNYWLRVTDNFNCVGSDTIIVNPKQCLEGFFIPNAFTPNKDGKNDIFRPLLFGVIKNLKFVIYDRWGQKVYETTKIDGGWDGKVSGKDADSNVFVWTCEYQFEGQDRKFAKGTVVLIR